MTDRTTDVRNIASAGFSRRTLMKTGIGAIAAPAVLRVNSGQCPEQGHQDRSRQSAHRSARGLRRSRQFHHRSGARHPEGRPEDRRQDYPVQIISKDSQSTGSRAAEVASELILGGQGRHTARRRQRPTPPTRSPTRPRSTRFPASPPSARGSRISSAARAIPRRASPGPITSSGGWRTSSRCSWRCGTARQPTRSVGGLFPNDADGNAWGDPKLGLPPALVYGRLQARRSWPLPALQQRLSSQIAAFKAAGGEIVTGNMIPPDFATFWSQAAQQGFRPKIVTIGKALLFPSVIESLGARGNGLTTEIWWTPNHPFKSGLTGQSAKQLADAYTAATKRPWTQPIGFVHALFEVAVDVLKRSKAIDPKAILDAITTTDYKSIVGPVHWSGQPVKNVSKTPLVSGQWQRVNDQYDLVICQNKTAPEIPVGGKLKLLS